MAIGLFVYIQNIGDYALTALPARMQEVQT